MSTRLGDNMMILGLPSDVWWSVIVVVGIGIVVLAIDLALKKYKFWHELVRDVGIAFIVAGVVSATYEFNTRSVEERRTTLDTINHAMLAFIPASVWNEVEDQIIRRHAIRRNVRIEMQLSHEAPRIDGKLIPLPPGQSVMSMSYSYDLYGLAAGELSVSVEHELDTFSMWNESLKLPRFDRVVVSGPGVNDVYEGSKLEQISNGKGAIKINVQLNRPPSGRPVHIVTERHELVTTPGAYYLVVRELTSKVEGSNEPTFRIAITQLPPDLDAGVNTYYAAHGFIKTDPKINVWTFDGTMLPGQGVDVLFRKRS